MSCTDKRLTFCLMVEPIIYYQEFLPLVFCNANVLLTANQDGTCTDLVNTTGRKSTH